MLQLIPHLETHSKSIHAPRSLLRVDVGPTSAAVRLLAYLPSARVTGVRGRRAALFARNDTVALVQFRSS